VTTTDHPVWAEPYNFDGACAGAPQVCLGVPYFNWGPAYLDAAQSVIDTQFEAEWRWLGPDWDDINDRDRSAVVWLSYQVRSACPARTVVASTPQECAAGIRENALLGLEVVPGNR
jgi:simple sugar transport system substrate-binding protein